MHLPSPVYTYFTAQAPQDHDTLAAAFAQNAVVHDEGRTYRGPRAIGAWWLAAKDRYRDHAEPIDMSESGAKTVVRANVTGNFPGSPAVLTFTFGLDGDRISDLEIG